MPIERCVWGHTLEGVCVRDAGGLVCMQQYSCRAYRV